MLLLFFNDFNAPNVIINSMLDFGMYFQTFIFMTCISEIRSNEETFVLRACALCSPNVTNHMCANCQCVPGDGVDRMALTVNRMIPGPTIQVCKGDRLVIDVVNHIDEESVTIHWHGILQMKSPYFDGVPYVTQCPIQYANIFR